MIRWRTIIIKTVKWNNWCRCDVSCKESKRYNRNTRRNRITVNITMNAPTETEEQDIRHRDLVIDNVLSTQPELGPIIPDGGYGWIVFIVSLFFQLLIPSLLIAFGVFLAFSRMKTDFLESHDPKLWDHQVLYVPLFFVATWTFVDPTSRKLITQSTWPKLFAVAGTCLTCAGLLFLWMGMTGQNSAWLFVLSGIVTGIGGSIQMAQCEILLAQYFRLKLPAITHMGHAVSAVGFILTPVLLGRHILTNTETQVLLWYQALILQGLILNLLLRKPMYLKSPSHTRYDYVATETVEDEEDIFSKNSRELQIKVQSGSNIKIETHQLPQVGSSSGSADRKDTPTSSHHSGSNKDEDLSKDWVTFDDERDEDEGEITTYKKVHGWETFDGDTLPEDKPDQSIKKWETFDDDAAKRNSKNLELEMSFGKHQDAVGSPTTTAITGVPIPLFSDTPVNNNTSYSYDAFDDPPESLHSSVFVPNVTHVASPSVAMRNTMELLRTPTFYKSLLTIMTTKWSLFAFFTLFPSFLLQEVSSVNLTKMCSLMGIMSLTTLLFAGAAYWINVEKRWRPKMVWFLSWFGALGYFLISDYFTEGVLLFGAVMIALSIAVLQHIGAPLLGLTIKGEPTKEYNLISVLVGLTFLFFVLINASFKNIFRMMALLNLLTGSVWLGNYIYKRVRV